MDVLAFLLTVGMILALPALLLALWVRDAHKRARGDFERAEDVSPVDPGEEIGGRHGAPLSGLE